DSPDSFGVGGNPLLAIVRYLYAATRIHVLLSHIRRILPGIVPGLLFAGAWRNCTVAAIPVHSNTTCSCFRTAPYPGNPPNSWKLPPVVGRCVFVTVLRAS